MRVNKFIRKSPILVLSIFTMLIFLRDESKLFYFSSLIINEVVGVSVWTNCVMLSYAIRHKLCAYYFVSIIGFFLFNITNIAQLIFFIYELNFEYFNIYVGILSLIVLSSSILLFIFRYEK